MKLDIYLTPFANRFGMLRDKFGTSWMLLDEAEAEPAKGQVAGDAWIG